MGSFDGIWWSVEVPTGWNAYRDEGCVTFQRSTAIGALQISSALNDSSLITDTDLEEFALERLPAGARLTQVTYGQFSGLTTSFQKNDSMWREWWLRSGRLMV